MDVKRAKRVLLFRWLWSASICVCSMTRTEDDDGPSVAEAAFVAKEAVEVDDGCISAAAAADEEEDDAAFSIMLAIWNDWYCWWRTLQPVDISVNVNNLTATTRATTTTIITTTMTVTVTRRRRHHLSHSTLESAQEYNLRQYQQRRGRQTGLHGWRIPNQANGNLSHYKTRKLSVYVLLLLIACDTTIEPNTAEEDEADDPTVVIQLDGVESNIQFKLIDVDSVIFILSSTLHGWFLLLGQLNM